MTIWDSVLQLHITMKLATNKKKYYYKTKFLSLTAINQEKLNHLLTKKSNRL